MRRPGDNAVAVGQALALALLTILGLWMRAMDLPSGWARAGWMNFSVGMVLLGAYLLARVLKRARLPLISGYIIAGIAAGPYGTGFLDDAMVTRLRLVDDLALSFIALTAGASLNVAGLRGRGRLLGTNLVLNIVVVFVLVAVFVQLAGHSFSFSMDTATLGAFAMLLGAISVARSPASAIAVIGECRAAGPLTDMVLGVTILIDVVIIILFSAALSLAKALLAPGTAVDWHVLAALLLEMGTSLCVGAGLGLLIAWYIRYSGRDMALLLLFFGVAVTKIAMWLGGVVQIHFGVALHLEPLLICISAGFVARHTGPTATALITSLQKSALPIYVLFFTLAGASLDFGALSQCWLFAVCLVVVRSAGLAAAAWLGKLSVKNAPASSAASWMGYVTQAGVSIGLAGIAQRQVPEIGRYLTTVVLAVISINQLIGPVLFKLALTRAGETRSD